MHVPARLKRAVFTAALMLSVVVALCFAGLVIIVGSAIAFSGSSGNAWQTFINGLLPVAYFAAGAVAVGGLAALVNAVAVSHGVWAKSIAAGSFIGGVVGLLNPALARALLSLSNPVLAFLGRVFINK